MSLLFVRWLGAFRAHGGNLNDSLVYEMNRQDEVAAEIIDNSGSNIHHARVGLLVDEAAVIKKFNGDCWSEYDSNGRLYKTCNPRRNNNATWREAWVAPKYTGIVVKGKDLPKRITRTIVWASKEYGLPIYRLTKRGELREVEL